jgi:hypothetical protein
MRVSQHNEIRRVLLTANDGMTALEIAKILGREYRGVQRAMRSVWGVHIDRWQGPVRGQFSAVYVCDPVPPDAPHPTKRRTPISLIQKGLGKQGGDACQDQNRRTN